MARAITVWKSSEPESVEWTELLCGRCSKRELTGYCRTACGQDVVDVPPLTGRLFRPRAASARLPSGNHPNALLGTHLLHGSCAFQLRVVYEACVACQKASARNATPVMPRRRT